MQSPDASLAMQALLSRRRIDGSCWLWTGANNGLGYGVVILPGGRRVTTHRLAAELWLGLSADSTDLVLHECDRPPCFNPGHLKIGSQSDNMLDAFRRGRLVPPVYHGAEHPRARLTDADVHRIRERHEAGASYVVLAREFAVNRSTIRRADLGQTWAHLPRNAPTERQRRRREEVAGG